MLSTNSGFSNLLKEGNKHYSGLDETIIKNIDACKEISSMTKTSYGPNAMKKMVINYLEKVFITSDTATMLREMEVHHPAAKLITMASKMQEDECGDGTNFVITLAGELLEQAESLIKMGLHPSLILAGYEEASKKCIQILDTLEATKLKDPRDIEEVKKFLKCVMTSKLTELLFSSNFRQSDFFSNLVAQACVRCLPVKVNNFNIESIRVNKILGASMEDSFVMPGLIVQRVPETQTTNIIKPRIALYGVPLDTQNAETKGSILIKNAKELLDYTKGEEAIAENLVLGLKSVNINFVVVGGSISELVLHYLEKYDIGCIKVTSKFELRRLAKALQATCLVRLGAPIEEEIGYCDEIDVQEVSSQKVTVFKKDSETCKLTTIVLRGSTTNLLDDVERAIDDAVNCYRCMIKDPRFVYGASAVELQLSKKLEHEANLVKGLEQYSYHKFSKAFEVFSRILSDNAGLNSNEFLPKILAANEKGSFGIDIESGEIKDSSKLEVFDHLMTKSWAIKLAVESALTILRVDQIIVAKQSGGPKPKTNTNWDED